MKLHILHFALLPSIMAFAGCATLMHGRVVEQVDSHEAKVALGPNEVKPGDRVAFFEEKCPSGFSRLGGGCSTERVGNGVVTETVGKNYAIVRTPKDVQIKKHMIVQREV